MANPAPSESDLFTHLLDRLRLAEEAAYILGHYFKESDDAAFGKGQGFLGVGEMLKMTQVNVTNLATKSIRAAGGFR